MLFRSLVLLMIAGRTAPGLSPDVIALPDPTATILPRAVEWFVGGRLRLEDGSIMLDGKLLAQPVIVEEPS